MTQGREDQETVDQAKVDQAVERAREAVRAEQRARDALQDAIDARADANAAVVELAHQAMSYNDMARAVGLNASTFLSDTKDARRRLRAARKQNE